MSEESDSLSSSSLGEETPTIRHRVTPKTKKPNKHHHRHEGGKSLKTQTTATLKQIPDFSSSSGVAGDESTGDLSAVTPVRVKRRKKRKRQTPTLGLDEDDEETTKKVIDIELALVSMPDNPTAGLERLKNLAISEDGLVHDYLRRKVWPKLLGIDIFETEISPSQEDLEAHKFYNQVVLDVNRSLKRFPPGIAEDDRPMLQDQLTRLIIRVLAKHPDLHYYQGYHDVAITFLLVVGEQLGFQIVEKLSIGAWLREFMLPTMDRTNHLLQFIYPILLREDAKLHEFLCLSEVGTIFALPWLITWFGHVLPHYSDVVRLYDFFIAQPPLMPVYLAAAIVLFKKDDILADECDMATVHSILARIPVDAPFEKLLKVSLELYVRYPPCDLEDEVEARMKQLQDELVSRRNAAMKKYVNLAKPVSSGTPDRSKWSIKRVLFVAAPVVVGILLWKYLHSETSIVELQ